MFIKQEQLDAKSSGEKFLCLGRAIKKLERAKDADMAKVEAIDKQIEELLATKAEAQQRIVDAYKHNDDLKLQRGAAQLRSDPAGSANQHICPV